ncbi:MAG: undecaprenyldiphospho-muramoylpentapeptide beta-N-acetylglucosaminyltransferase [Solitalea-like symbiont of Acarus siro]
MKIKELNSNKIKNSPYRILLSGGGTGGHIFPALAIADAIKLKNPKAQILFVGSKGKIEMSKVPEHGYDIIGIPIDGLQRKLSLKNIILPLKLVYAVLKALIIIKKFKPTVVIGTGGYVSGPVLFVAALKKIPTIIQEQNSISGLTNKILSRYVTHICVAYDNMQDYFPAKKIIFTGNPVRKQILDVKKLKNLGLEYFNLKSDVQTILCLGGSLGADTINSAILNSLDVIEDNNLQLIWQCGPNYYDKIKKTIRLEKYPNIIIKDFIENVQYAYAVADIIISRAGAMTIAELAIIGKAVILVPSPNVTNNHQTNNALALVKQKAAIYINNNQAEKDLIKTAVELSKNKKEQQKISKNLAKIARCDSSYIIAKLALSY